MVNTTNTSIKHAFETSLCEVKWFKENVTSISKRQRTTMSICTKEFNGVLLNVFGTQHKPLFKVCEVNEILKCDDIRETINDLSDEWKVKEDDEEMLTEQGLYALLFAYKKEIANEFSTWISASLIKPREQILSDLMELKGKKYEEIEKPGSCYIMRLDGGNKIGKTKDAASVRAKGLQTGNVSDIQILYEHKTSNPELVEKMVHYILDRYRSNSNREFFTCNVEYSTYIIKFCGNLVDTLKSTFETISYDEIIEKLREKGFGLTETKCASDNKTLDDDAPNDESTPTQYPNEFFKWLDENVIEKKGGILKLQEVCRKCENLKEFVKNGNLHSSMSTNIKGRVTEFLEMRYPGPGCPKYIDSTTNGKRVSGWLGLELKYNNDFQRWLYQNIVYKKDNLLKLQDICKRFTGKNTNTHESHIYRTQVEEFIEECFPELKSGHGVVKIEKKTCKGWKNLCIRKC